MVEKQMELLSHIVADDITERKSDMGKAVLYVRVDTEEQLVNDHAEKQAVADGLNPVNNERIGLCDALIRKDLCKPSK